MKQNQNEAGFLNQYNLNQQGSYQFQDNSKNINTQKTEGANVFGQQNKAEGGFDYQSLLNGSQNAGNFEGFGSSQQGGFDLTNYGLGSVSSNVTGTQKQTTTTTTTTVKKEGTTTASTTGNFDFKDFNFDMNNFNLNMPETSGSSNINNFKQTTTTTTTKTTSSTPNVDLKEFGITSQAGTTEDYSKFLQSSQPIDLKQYGLEATPSSMQQTTTTTTTTKTESATPNVGVNEQTTSQVGTTEDYSKFFQTTTTSEPIDLKQFGFETTPSSMQQTTTTTTTTKTESTTPNVDLKEFGILEQTASQPTEDFSKYFKETKTTTTKTTGPVDLKEFGNYFDGSSQQKTTTTTTTTKTTKTENAALDNLGMPASTTGFSGSTSNAVSYGNAQSSSSNYNTYGATKTTVTKATYTGPTQTYSYKYSYNMPATASKTVTQTTYTGVTPGTTLK